MLCQHFSSGKIAIKGEGKSSPSFMDFSKKMILSHFTKTYPYKEKPGYLLLFSTKTASKILIKEKTYNSIINNTLSRENEMMLADLGIVVSDRNEERKEVLSLLDYINEKSTKLNISVIVNLACNFDCLYCYEGDIKGKLFMTDETAGSLIDFIKSKFTPDKKSINIDFYGGEPLLSRDIIKQISRELKLFAESRGAEYTFTLVTNGSLFTRKISEELISIGLAGIKVTIDGPPEVHNACRPFRSGEGSFNTILKNISESSDLLKIGIGGNYTKGNYKKFPELFNYLEKAGMTPERTHQLKFDPVMDRHKSEKSPTEFTDGFMSVNEPWLTDTSIYLRDEVLKRGYSTPKIKPIPCQVDIKDTYVVNYEGMIYKCPVFIGKKGYEIGDLKNGINDSKDVYRKRKWREDKCEDCEYFPLCFGGCRYMSYVRDGNIDNVDCKKPHLDAVLETLIKQDIKYGLKA